MTDTDQSLTWQGKDDHLPSGTLDLIDDVWGACPDSWTLGHTQGSQRSVTATIQIDGAPGPFAQVDALEALLKAATVIGPLARNLRWERNAARDALQILDDEFGHAEAAHNPRALEAIAILRAIVRDDP